MRLQTVAYAMLVLTLQVLANCPDGNETCPNSDQSSLLQNRATVTAEQKTNTLMRGDDMRNDGVTLPLPHFQMISQGTCADIGLSNIKETGECVAAFNIVASSLTGIRLSTVKAEKHNSRPSGCIYWPRKVKGKMRPTLKMNTNGKDPFLDAASPYQILCKRSGHSSAKGQVPTCAEELLVRYKASRMLNTHSRPQKRLFEDIGAWDTDSEMMWTKFAQPITLGPALVRLVFHDYVDHNNLASAGTDQFQGGFDACMHAPAKSDEQKGFDADLESSHNSGLSLPLRMIRVLTKATNISVPDGIVLATATYLEGMAGLTRKIEMKFGRAEADCDAQGGNQFGRDISNQVYLRASPTKFDEPEFNLQFFKSVLNLTAREMVALYGAHTLGGLNNGVIPYGSMGGPREAPFCENGDLGGTPINDGLKGKVKLSPDSRSITRDSAFFDVWFDETPGTFDVNYFQQMLDEWDLYAASGSYNISGIWAESMNTTWTGAHGIAHDLNRNEVVGEAFYAAPDFPLCGQSGGTLLGAANNDCRKTLKISQATLDTKAFSCPRWSDACEAGRWCRHIPAVNHPNQANIKSLMKWTTFGGRKGRVVTLPSDWALLMIDETRTPVREFVQNPESFHQAFADVFKKMVDTGGHTGLQQCSPVACSAEAQTFVCDALVLENCDFPPAGSNCQLVGSFGTKGEVSCASTQARRNHIFSCDIKASEAWEASLPVV